MPALDSAQHYIEVGILILSLLVFVPTGWFTSGYGIKLAGLVFAKEVSRRALVTSRVTGGLVGAVLAVLLWSGFSGRGVPGPGGPGGTGTDRSGQTPVTLVDKDLAPSNPAPAQTIPSVPPAITTDGKQRQVRVAVLGDGTQPRYAQDNRFFILLDGPDHEPLGTDDLLGKLKDWHSKHQVGHVILSYSSDSASPGHSDVRKLQKGVESERMQFTTKFAESGKWVP